MKVRMRCASQLDALPCRRPDGAPSVTHWRDSASVDRRRGTRRGRTGARRRRRCLGGWTGRRAHDGCTEDPRGATLGRTQVSQFGFTFLLSFLPCSAARDIPIWRICTIRGAAASLLPGASRHGFRSKGEERLRIACCESHCGALEIESSVLGFILAFFLSFFFKCSVWDGRRSASKGVVVVGMATLSDY